MKNEYFGLILAGGQGTRFWPWSTEKKPKQFLNIIGENSLVTQTFDRLKKFIKKDNIFIIADKKYLELIKESIPEFSESNFIDEPFPRNTAPSLILSNIILSQINEEINLLVVPADHFIPDVDIFSSQMKSALEFAHNRCIITSGIKPDMPHTGYGYINFNKNKPFKLNGAEFFDVVEFKEKPEIHIAERYLKEGNYYWNSGMFVYKLRHFKDFFKEYSSYYFEKYIELEKNLQNRAKFIEIFENIKSESIDYALMEKVKEVKMFKAGFEWNDVGAWSSVYELREKDSLRNVSNKKKNILIDSKGSLVFSTEEKPIAVIGLKNVAIINTENGVLISDLKELQKVKKVIQLIKNT